MPQQPKRCRTPACPRTRRARDLLCTRCWALVPAPIRRDVLAHHHPGSIRQTPEYFTAVDEAIDAAQTAITTPGGTTTPTTTSNGDTK